MKPSGRRRCRRNCSPDKISKYLSKDQARLYELVWKRFLASQMANAMYDSTRIDITSDRCVFRATGSIQKFDGFLALYEETVEEPSEEGDDENVRLPEISSGVSVPLKNILDKQHFTQPPPRYSEATLVRELEDKGIGRPSTYAQIIDTLKRRKYVTVESRKFTPTEVGFMVKDILVKQFADVFDVGFTASMEDSLDKVEVGDAQWATVLQDFYTPFAERLAGVKNNIRDLKAANQKVTDRICPECNKFPLVIKWSKNGKFLACQGFPAWSYGTARKSRACPVDRSVRQMRSAHACAGHQRQPFPRVLGVSGMQEHEIDLDGRGVSPRRVHRSAHRAQDEARKDVFRVRRVSEMHLCDVGQAGGAEMRKMRLPDPRVQRNQEKGHLPQVS